MKKKRLGFFAKLLILVVVLGILTCLIDYTRVLDNEEPMFAIKSYDRKTKIQKYRGFFYIVERKITISEKESMKDSKDITFKVLLFELNLEARKTSDKKVVKLSYTKEDDCTASKLIYATEDIKVYTYCINDLKITENNKETKYNTFFKDQNITNIIPYSGLGEDKSTEIYIDENNEYAKDGIKLYRCNNKNDKKSLYFTSKDTEIQSDFCTFKDDDFAFTFKIEDTSPEDICKSEDKNNPLPPEIFYEDETNQYTFDCKKQQYIKLSNYYKELTLYDALSTNQVTINDLKNKGLVFNTVSKETKEE